MVYAIVVLVFSVMILFSGIVSYYAIYWKNECGQGEEEIRRLKRMIPGMYPPEHHNCGCVVKDYEAEQINF